MAGCVFCFLVRTPFIVLGDFRTEVLAVNWDGTCVGADTRGNCFTVLELTSLGSYRSTLSEYAQLREIHLFYCFSNQGSRSMSYAQGYPSVG